MRDFKQEIFDMLDVQLQANGIKLTMVDIDRVDLTQKEVPKYLLDDDNTLEYKMEFAINAPIVFAKAIKELIESSNLKGDVEIGIEDMKMIEIPEPKEARTLIALRGSLGINIVNRIKV